MDLPFSGICTRRGMEHGPEVLDGFSQGIGPETERALDQTYLTPDTVLDLKNPGRFCRIKDAEVRLAA